MYWRQEKGEKWESTKGPVNRARFKKLVRTNKAHGALAYCGAMPIGWVSFDRRTDFSKLDRAPSLKCSDAETVWSIPCFYVKAGYRNKGVAKALLKFAVAYLKREKKVRVIEGYPVRNKVSKIPAAFAWTGTESLFKSAGFKPTDSESAGKRRMRISK